MRDAPFFGLLRHWNYGHLPHFCLTFVNTTRGREKQSFFPASVKREQIGAAGLITVGRLTLKIQLTGSPRCFLVRRPVPFHPTVR